MDQTKHYLMHKELVKFFIQRLVMERQGKTDVMMISRICMRLCEAVLSEDTTV